MYFVITVIIVQIICGLIMRSAARKKHASETFWLLVGLILGPFALIAIPLIKKNHE